MAATDSPVSLGEDEVDPQQVPPRRRWRTRKIVLISVGTVVVLVLGLVGYVLVSTNATLGSMRRLGDPFKALPAKQRPPAPSGPAAADITFLVGGLDTRSSVPTTGTQAQSDERGRTDTLMLVRLIAGGKGGAYVVSIPRDSWVPIPGHGDGKVNWAYNFGGAPLAIRTVEDLTDVRINHIAMIDWDGFQDVINSLGGVTVNVPDTSSDPANDVTWTKGVHHLDGAEALLYVRDRYGLANGDFGREQRQQNILRAIFTELGAKASPANPLLLRSLTAELARAVSVDSTLTNSDMAHLALSLRKLSMSSIVFATVPYDGTGQVGTQSVVNLDPALDKGFWNAFSHDDLAAFMSQDNLPQLGSTVP